MAYQSYTEDLELRLVKLQRRTEQYDVLKTNAHSLVTHWQVTDVDRYSLRLHYYERIRDMRGKVVAAVPKGRTYRYGLMADERIAIEECYEISKLVHEIFWKYEPNTTEIVQYVQNRPVLIGKLDYAEGLPILCRHYGYHKFVSRVREIYTHADERLTTIKCEDTEFGQWATEYRCIYTPQRELERIDYVTAFPAGYPNTIYTIYRAPIAQHASTPEAKRQELVKSIVDKLEKQQIRDKVCGLMLNYVEPNFFPPMIVVLYEDERLEMLAQKPSSRDDIWAPVPDGSRGRDFIELNESIYLWTELERDITDEDDARAFLADIARDLMRVDWTGKLDTTDDFVAYSLDYEADSVQERLNASVPQEKLDLLRARGLW
jgi:hypothetical protein